MPHTVFRHHILFPDYKRNSLGNKLFYFWTVIYIALYLVTVSENYYVSVLCIVEYLLAVVLKTSDICTASV